MRILMVTSFYPPHHFGGDGTYVHQLTQALRRRGHEVDVVYCYDAYRVSGGRKQLSMAATAPGVHCLKSRFGRFSHVFSYITGNPGLKWGALDDLMRNSYDVTHFHNISLMGGPKILTMSSATVKLFTAHEHWTVCPTHIFWKNRSKACDAKTCFTCQIRSGRPPQLWRYTNLMTDSFNYVDWLFAPSEFTKDKLAGGGIDCPMSVMPLFAAPTFEELSEELPIGHRPKFLFVGRVTRSKGVDRLLHLFASRPHLDLDVVGDGDLRTSLQKEYASSNNLRFLGQVSQQELKQMYRTAHALVLPSVAPETFGLVTVEAFSQGTPAIVRNAGGAAESVFKSGAGLIFDTDVEAGDAIDLLANDQYMRDELGQKARQAFLADYTENHHVSRYLAKIEELTLSNSQASSS